MKIAATLVVFFAATASAFGLHNGVTAAVKTITKAGFSKPMVQAVDINGNRLNAGVRKYNDIATFFLEDMMPLSKPIRQYCNGIDDRIDHHGVQIFVSFPFPVS
jgi:hypothetical protein